MTFQIVVSRRKRSPSGDWLEDERDAASYSIDSILFELLNRLITPLLHCPSLVTPPTSIHAATDCLLNYDLT